jgi:Rps23 Pro-64 3,4-dihydroxylase Tpa1-like proline 4-hydroxylase
MAELLERLLPHAKLRDKTWTAKLAEQYASAEPYPHIAVDDFFDEEVLRRVLRDFPDPQQLGVKFDNVREVKNATHSEYEIPAFARTFIHALNSAPFIEFIEDVTGIRGLVADPHLVGGGFHALARGGKLSIHTDFNYHKRLRLDRRVNVLVYLNENWPEEYGGYFEAWRPHGRGAEARYLPTFNRLVMFTTTDFTFHGNPDPVACPEGMARKSIAMYYYTNGRPKAEWSGLTQTTRFMDRPGEAVAERDPLWYRAARVAPRPVREWFTRQVHRKAHSRADNA